MKRGAKPTPTYLRVITGNPGKRPLNQDEPQPVGDLNETPAWLTESQRAGWAYAIEHAPRGLLKHLDRSVLVVWVVAEDCHRQAAQEVSRLGMLVKAPNTGVPMQSPFMAIMNKQAHIMLNAAAQMGFTPSSRSQISVEPTKGNAFSNNGRRPTPA